MDDQKIDGILIDGLLLTLLNMGMTKDELFDLVKNILNGGEIQ